MYQALYRKWRPKTFDEVVGQEHITETLRSQSENGRLSHAYIFTGTRGTGKTTCAKILAKAVNCLDPQHGNPCCRCKSCLGIDDGSVLDVLEFDAASNSRVDEMRAVLEETVYTPASAKKRVYIIDEVHMLSTSAFNALLKTLEEPPEHILFILATTELHKVPATILSRCQRFAFRRIEPSVVAARVMAVAKAEGIPLTQDAADLLARLSDGALRDALSLLDQCAGEPGELDPDKVRGVLGLIGRSRSAELLEAIAASDAALALTMLDEFYRGGKELKPVLDELALLCRDVLMLKTAPKAASGLVSRDGLEIAAGFSGRLEAKTLVNMILLLQQTQQGLVSSTNARLDAELAIIRLCGLSTEPAPTAEAPKAEPKKAAPQPIVKNTPPQPAVQSAPPEPPKAAAGNWQSILAALKDSLARPEYAALSRPGAVSVSENGGRLIAETDSSIVYTILRTAAVVSEIEKVSGKKAEVRLTESKAVSDNFQRLLAFGEGRDNVKIY